MKLIGKNNIERIENYAAAVGKELLGLGWNNKDLLYDHTTIVRNIDKNGNITGRNTGRYAVGYYAKRPEGTYKECIAMIANYSIAVKEVLGVKPSKSDFDLCDPYLI